MRFKTILSLLLIFALAASALAGCGKNNAESPSGDDQTDIESAANTESDAATDDEPEESNPIHGLLTSAAYTAAASFDKSDDFSFYLADENGKFVFRATVYDSEGNVKMIDAEATLEDMEELRSIFDEYGYEELIGQKDRYDPEEDGEAPLDAPTYLFSASYADGSSFSVPSAGEGAAKLSEFFRGLAARLG
ncbi:MAG: hypothetical protein IJT70_05550 [Clostridia bacterium]|nr:hypothetical protein [Clostridia bacterium]